MAQSIISYDKDLPEIPGRKPHEPPTCFLRKKEGTADEFEIIDGRRPSKLLLVERLRADVDKWRKSGYPGASIVTQRFLNFWFDEDHLVGDEIFRFHFGQQEAAETLLYLVEVKKIRDAKLLVETFGQIFYPVGSQQKLTGIGIIHKTSNDGKRQIRRYIPEKEDVTIQELPPENLPRYAFKMATGSGKTVVMAMLMAWSYFHKRKVPSSRLSDNFLVVAPNVIVYQRLEKDFASSRIFYELPIIPPEWRNEWQNLKVILRGDSAEPGSSGNLFLTNIQQIYESQDAKWTPENAIEAILGPKPVKDLTSNGRSMLERIKTLKHLMVLNDEAHHVHDEDLQWTKSLMNIHAALPSGLSLWLDFSATPKDQNGTYFPWIICDYPLAQAVEDRIVKAPIIVHQVKRKDPEHITEENIIESYGDWLRAAASRWKEHYETYRDFGLKPILFVMTENNKHADAIGNWLKSTRELGFKEKEILIIHTDTKGEITKKDLEEARTAARDVDSAGNPYKVIVSVLMLREGWDVKNVTVVLGLRPFTSKAKILPEQAVGRGLRLMEGISPDRTQSLEVIGTSEFESFVRELEKEGVGVKTVTTPPATPVKIYPVAEKINYDIILPLTKPVYWHNYKRLSQLDVSSLDPIFDQDEVDERLREKLRFDFVTTETEVHQADIFQESPPMAQNLLASITNKAIASANLPQGFADLYPIVRDYVQSRCFGKVIDLEKKEIRLILRDPILQEGTAKYLARKIGELAADQRPLEFEKKELRLSDTKAFTWRRDLRPEPLNCTKTIFNLVATYNSFERKFARFLDEKCKDILRLASLGTTEQQESGTRFRVDYLKPSGAIGFYHPDWVAVQETSNGEVNWIIETKGRVWEDTPAKDAAISEWCRKVSEQTGEPWRYIRVNQTDFERGEFSSFADLEGKILGSIPRKGK